jgi:hypothetical protein
MKKILLSAAALSVAAVLPTLSSAAASTATTLTGMTPRQVLATTLRAAAAQRTADSVVTTSTQGLTLRAVTESGPSSGIGYLNVNGHRGEIIYLKGVVYARFDPAIVKFELNSTNVSVANKWISITRTSRYYSNLAEGDTLPSVLQELSPAGTLSMSTTSFSGRNVIALTGASNATVGVPGGVQTLYVSPSAPFLPVGGDIRAITSGVSIDLVIQMKNWGAKVDVHAPSTSTPITTTPLK